MYIIIIKFNYINIIVCKIKENIFDIFSSMIILIIYLSKKRYKKLIKT